jgi:HupE/UreJ protein
MSLNALARRHPALLAPLLLAALLVAVLLATTPRAAAHEFKLDLAMSSFVRIEPGQAHLVVRVPLELLRAVHFPAKGAEIDVDRAGDAMQRAVALVTREVALYEDGHPLTAHLVAARLSLPSDRSFQRYDKAVQHVAAAPEPDTRIVLEQGYFDVHLAAPIASTASTFALRTSLAAELGPALKLAVRYLPAEGDARVLMTQPQREPLTLNPGWATAASGFVGLGIAHIITGYDHLLFLLCLLMPLRGVRQILTVVTGFTLAHSVTLIGSAVGLAPAGAWFPPFVETAIALSIVYMALENIMGADVRRRVLLTMLFGLVHGFGFSYGLTHDLQFAGGHLVVALLGFNAGIELGQLLVIALMLPALLLVRRFVLPGRVGEIILAALAAHMGWHWMQERYADLALAPWPAPDAAGMALLLGWLAALLLIGTGVVALLKRLRLDVPAIGALPAGADD